MVTKCGFALNFVASYFPCYKFPSYFNMLPVKREKQQEKKNVKNTNKQMDIEQQDKWRKWRGMLNVASEFSGCFFKECDCCCVWCSIISISFMIHRTNKTPVLCYRPNLNNDTINNLNDNCVG